MLRHERVILTPHIAAATPEGRYRSVRDAVVQAKQVLRGERPRHLLIESEVWPRVLERVEAGAG